MPIDRRIFLIASASAAAVSSWQAAFAQAAPLEQAKILVGFPPGGGTDSCARRLADGLRGSNFAKIVLVDNKSGAGGRLAVDELLRGPSDGSLMVVQPEAVLTQQPLVDPKNTHYRLDDLAPVGAIGRIQHAFAVGPAVPGSVKNMKDFIDWARANPLTANFGTPGTNSAQDFLMRPMLKDIGLQLTHAPYRGSAPGVQDLIAGQISAFLSPVGDSLPYQATGRMRLLATSGERRSKFAPDVPTFIEQGMPGMTLTEWFGVWMSRKTLEPVRATAAAAVRAVTQQPTTVEFLAKLGIEVTPITQEEFATAIRASSEAWAERLRKINFKPET